MSKKLLALSLIVLNILVLGQSEPPKRELRAVWVASVANLDWPGSPSLSVEAQKQKLISYLDDFKSGNLNSIIFQIRPECDALYQSNIEPWSYWLTGQQGRAPDPFYDPLEMAVEEAHKRGLELQAWFNPYRAERTVGYYGTSPEHVVNKHPEWILDFTTLKILNPGIPAVRDYITSVVMDVVRRYDIDGVHLDDYFYPYPPNQITNQDNATFQQYPNGFTNIGDWRRNNVNMLMKMLQDSIKAEKPWVRFGISPFGIWKNGVPPGISGMDAYNVIYADPMNWLHVGSVDYLTPQLYWQIGGGQDFSKLMPWWADSTVFYGRHYYPGHIFNASYNNRELPRQLTLSREYGKSSGNFWFRAALLQANDKGFLDSLKNDYYRYLSLIPSMNWIDSVKPNIPQNLVFGRIPGKGIAALQWENSIPAGDGDIASRFVVYNFDQPQISQTDIDDPANMDAVTDKLQFNPSANTGGAHFYGVTSLDRNWNESDISNVVEIAPPVHPQLISPANGEPGLSDSIALRWNYADGAASYRIQLSDNSSFSTIIADISGIDDTTYIMTGLEGQKSYWWRMASVNPSGSSTLSAPFSFTTGFPVSPALQYPANNSSGIGIDVDFYWQKSFAADSYNLQVARSRDFTEASMVANIEGLTDTTALINDLAINSFHFWRVKALNNLGSSNWSEVFTFKTVLTGLEVEWDNIPDKFVLNPNYPNPFNPSTSITFGLPEESHVRLEVFNLIGERIRLLVDENIKAGYHRTVFEAFGLPSGMYYYVLTAKNKVLSGKMLLIK